MNSARKLTIFGAAALPFALALLANAGCKKDETAPPPPATVAPAPTPTPAEPTVIAPEEDAGSDAAEDADADAGKKVVGTGGDSTGIRKCCSALRQNAKSAPPEQQFGYNAAASACDALVNNPQGRAQLSTLRSFLKGANLPSSCQ